MSKKSEVLRTRRFRSLTAALFLGCAAAFLLGCAHSRPGCGVAQETILLASPFDVVWAAVVQEAAGLGTNSVADRTIGSVQTEDIAVDETRFPITAYACKPNGPFMDWSTSRLTVSFQVLPESAHETQITVACRYYRFSTTFTDAWRRWASNGRFEEQLLSSITARASR